MANQLLVPSPCCNPCCPTTSRSLTDIIREIISEDAPCDCKFITTQTVAEMRTILEYDTDWSFRTLGGASAGDGFGKDWRYDDTSLAVDDGSAFTVVIRPDNKPIGVAGRLVQQI